MKRGSKSPVTREMQIETTRYLLRFSRMTIIKQKGIFNIEQDVGKKGTLVNCWWECKLVQSLWKRVWNFLRNEKENYYTIKNSTSGTLPKVEDVSPVFIAAWFTIARIWKQLKCSLKDEWTKYHLAKKKRRISCHLHGWTLRALSYEKLEKTKTISSQLYVESKNKQKSKNRTYRKRD